MNRRDLAALVTVVVVAVPGLAVAQSGAGDAPADVEPTEPATEEATEVATEEPTDDPTEDASEDVTADVTTDATEEATEAGIESEADPLGAQEDQDVADEGHGELVSTLARCLPSGRELHGTGWTKGAIISQVASTGTFTAEDGTTTDVAAPEDAEALCEQVQAMADAAEEPGKAKGRPSWAGPDGDEGDEGDEVDAADAPKGDDRGGPPDHAPAKGRRGR